MNDMKPFANRTQTPDRSSRHIDDLLRDYFQQQMPHPWPAPPATRSEHKAVLKFQPPRQRPFRARRYLALAAAIALFVGGYLTLTAVFPAVLPANLMKSNGSMATKQETPNFLPDGPGVDSDKNGAQNSAQIVNTPRGPVRVLEQKSGNKVKINVQYLPQP